MEHVHQAGPELAEIHLPLPLSLCYSCFWDRDSLCVDQVRLELKIQCVCLKQRTDLLPSVPALVTASWTTHLFSHPAKGWGYRGRAGEYVHSPRAGSSSSPIQLTQEARIARWRAKQSADYTIKPINKYWNTWQIHVLPLTFQSHPFK